jgi:FtsP/CotA-like multicopper oxidase with cupredoxin domain
MSRNQRLALVAGAIVVAVVAFVIVQSGGSDSNNDKSGGSTVARIALSGNKVQSGPSTITATKGDTVHIVVTSDKPNTIHLHGYNIERQAAPGKPARFDFKANVEGVFEIESHTWEDAGLEPGVSKLQVRPS